MKSRPALDWVNFLIADVKDGLGPFLAIYLMSSQHWDATHIGVMMMIGGIATVAARAPAGALVDWTTWKRGLIVGFALMVLQRRLASSPAAIHARIRSGLTRSTRANSLGVKPRSGCGDSVMSLATCHRLLMLGVRWFNGALPVARQVGGLGSLPGPLHCFFRTFSSGNILIKTQGTEKCAIYHQSDGVDFNIKKTLIFPLNASY